MHGFASMNVRHVQDPIAAQFYTRPESPKIGFLLLLATRLECRPLSPARITAAPRPVAMSYLMPRPSEPRSPLEASWALQHI